MVSLMGLGNISHMYVRCIGMGEKKTDFTIPRTEVILYSHSSTGTVYPQSVQSSSLEVSSRMKPWATQSDRRASQALSRVWPRDLLRSHAAWISLWPYVSPHPYNCNDIPKAKTHLRSYWIWTGSETDRASSSLHNFYTTSGAELWQRSNFCVAGMTYWDYCKKQRLAIAEVG